MSESIFDLNVCDKLESRLGVSTLIGRDGKTIGIAEGGLVVLFAEPEKVPANALIYCVDYVKRKSQKGKDYIKCFKHVLSTEYDAIKQKCEEYRQQKELFEVLSKVPERYRDIVQKLLSEGTIDPNTLPENILAIVYSPPRGSPKEMGIEIYTTTSTADYFYGKIYDSDRRIFLNPRYIFAKVDDLDEFKVSEILSMLGGGWTITIGRELYAVLPRNKVNEKALKALERLNNYVLPYDVKRRTLEKLIDKLKVIMNEGKS